MLNFCFQNLGITSSLSHSLRRKAFRHIVEQQFSVLAAHHNYLEPLNIQVLAADSGISGSRALGICMFKQPRRDSDAQPGLGAIRL